MPSRPPLRILFVHYGQDWIRGSEQCLLDLMAHIDRTRFSPMVACNQRSMAQAVEALGVPAVVSEAAAPAPIVASTAQVGELQDIAAKFRAEIVHANAAEVAPALVRVARSLRIPLVVHLHYEPNASERRHQLLHQASLVVGVSQGAVAGLTDEGMHPQDVMVIHNAVDETRLTRGDATSLRRELGISPDVFVAATVGSLIPRKAHAVAIRALAEVCARGEDLHLLVCGSGPDEDALRALAAELDVVRSVHFLGYRPDAGAVMRDAVDVLIAPSTMEAMPLNVLEAQWLGIPVIASDIDAHREALLGDTSAVFPADDHAALADALMTLRTDVGRRQRAVKVTQAVARQHYSMKRYISEFESVYTRLTTARQSRYGWSATRWPHVYTEWLLDIFVKRVRRGSPSNRPGTIGASHSLRIVEAFRGEGTAWHSDVRIAEVTYTLKGAEEEWPRDASDTEDGSDASVGGEKSIFGLLRARTVAKLSAYAGETLHLQLEDGRVLPFTVAKHLDSRSCLIQAIGPIK